MFYTIYKITNTINNKIYIGKHQTTKLEDGYMGSGKMIQLAVKKYGIESFTKEILHVFDTEAQMNEMEKSLVVVSEHTYNLCSGGHGGFGYINENKLNRHYPNKKENNRLNLAKGEKALAEYYASGKHKELMGTKIRHMLKELYPDGTFKGKKHTEKTLEKIKNSIAGKQSGTKNSQFGSVWITNGTENKKMKNTDIVPNGWHKGRVT